MKTTTNVFLGGLTTDMHPLTTPQLNLTDALNATLITFNGNELMLLNDMGNTRIQDAKTGNIMGLREGFIPVGLKEHGGIMYIASVNKKGEGEIGTIPSPVIRYNKPVNTFIPGNTIGEISVSPNYPSELIKLTNTKVYTGERFAVAIQPIKDETINIFVETDESDSDDSSDDSVLEYPFYSKLNNKGLYKIKLYSQTEDQVFDLLDITIPEVNVESYNYLLLDQDRLEDRATWFANIIDDSSDDSSDDIEFDIDSMNILENNAEGISFLHYPNIPAGYPSIRIETETLDKFYLMPHDSSNVSYPLTFFRSFETDDSSDDSSDDETNNDGEYLIAIPGFIYETQSAVHVDKIEYSIIKNSTQEKMYLIIPGEEENIKDNHVIDLTQDIQYRRFKLSENKFQISKYGVQKESILDTSFDISKANILSYFVIPREELNTWFTLEATYYNHNWEEPIGRYSLQFNQFVMDIEKKFFNFNVEIEDLTGRLTGGFDSEKKYIKQSYNQSGSGDQSVDNGNFLSLDVDFLSSYFNIESTSDIAEYHPYRNDVTINDIVLTNDLPEYDLKYLYNSASYTSGQISLQGTGAINVYFDYIGSIAGTIYYYPNDISISNRSCTFKVGNITFETSAITDYYHSDHSSGATVLRPLGMQFLVFIPESVQNINVSLGDTIPITCTASATLTYNGNSYQIATKLVNIEYNNNASTSSLYVKNSGSQLLLKVPNLSCYHAAPQYNLIGKNEFTEEDYTKYGYSPEHKSFEPVNLLIQWDSENAKYKDGYVMRDFTEEEISSNLLKNTFKNLIKLYKTKVGVITGIEKGTYFLHFNLKNPSDAESIEFKLYQGTTEPNDYTFKLHEDGVIITSSKPFNLKLSSGSNKQLYSAGLYKIDKTIQCDQNTALDKQNLGNFGWINNENYKYVVPQLCWGYDENNIICGKNTYTFQNFGAYGFLTTKIPGNNSRFLMKPTPSTLSSNGDVETKTLIMPEPHYNISKVPIRKYISS